jgi:ABC-type polar amino acid transport system ATPase subunit
MAQAGQGVIFRQQDNHRTRLAALVVCRKTGSLMGCRQFDLKAFCLQLIRQRFRSEEFIVGYFRLRVDSQGDILVDGLSVKDKKNLGKIRQTCGMVFQQTVLFPHKDVLNNLTMAPMKLLGMSKNDAEDRARQLLDKVGLLSKEKAHHNELSGGEQQRIAIARALMMNPKALLLDEVTSALDPEMTSEVLKILEQLASEGVCMLAVTHEMTFARSVSSRILFMDKGSLVCDSPTEEFFTVHRRENERINNFLKFIGE